MKIQILSFILVAMILSPAISGVSADALPSRQVVEINENKIKDKSSTITNYKISLSEDITLDDKKNNFKDPNTSKISHNTITKSKTFKVVLNEDVKIFSGNEFDKLTNVKDNSERRTIMERISERTRIIKNSFENNFNPNISETFSFKDIFESNEINSGYGFNYFQLETKIIPFASIAELFEIKSDSRFNLSNSLLNNQHLLIGLGIVSFIVLLRNEDIRVSYSQRRIVKSVFLLTIFSATILVSPLSISTSYWGYAYGELGEQNNSTNIELINADNSTSSNPLQFYSVSLSEFIATSDNLNYYNFENSSQVNSTNQNTTSNTASLSESLLLGDSFIASNSTLGSTNQNTTSNTASLSESLLLGDSFIASNSTLGSTNQNTTSNTASLSESLLLGDSFIASNSTLGSTNQNTTSNTASLSESLLLGDSFIASNSTLGSTNQNTTSNTASLSESLLLGDSLTASAWEPTPEAILSLEFNDELDNSTSNSTALQLTKENSYVQVSNSTTNDLESFTVSSWVLPDYSKGSPEFTIVGKEKSFVLAINNKIKPEKVAKFAVFDGIKWTEIESTSIINNTWTNVAASFNGTTVDIFINGQHEASRSLDDQLVLSVNGKLVHQDGSKLYSEEDVVIGAYITTKKEIGKPSNQFAGEIDDVSLYNEYLSPKQVQSLYKEKLVDYQARDTSEKDLDTILAEIMAESQTNSTLSGTNSTLSGTNSTLSGTNSTLSGTNSTLSGTNSTLSGTNSTLSGTITEIINKTSINPKFTNKQKEFKIQENPTLSLDLELGQPNKAELKQKQIGKWKDQEYEIDSEIYDNQGKKIPLTVEYEKTQQGKFDIKVLKDQLTKPGVYKIKTTVLVDGKEHIIEEEFAWGLVSLNTKKSIYKPGDTADFVIVVLDKEGHPVCDANLSMVVTDPDNNLSILSSEDGISQNQECGLYDSQYDTSVEGTYNIDITAQTEEINTKFSTTFDVSSYFEFDIIRTAQSKIDPTVNPNSFDVVIDIESFVNTDKIIVTEYVPDVFDVQTDAEISIIDNQKVLKWNKELIENKTSVSYTYSIPMVFPQLYTLGESTIQYSDSEFIEARPWYVAADPETSFFDPTGTTQSGWNDGTGTTHTEIDDGTREPSSPVTNGDDIQSRANDNAISEFSFSSIGIPASNVNSITLWVYTSTGSNAQYSFELQQGGTQQCSTSVPTGTTNGWQSCVWDTSITDVSTLTAQFNGCNKNGGGGPTNCVVDAVYLEVDSILEAQESLSESATVSDTLTNVFTNAVIANTESLSESAAVSDTLNEVQTEGFVNRFESLSESVVISDQLGSFTSGATAYDASLSESTPISDQLDSFTSGAISYEILLSDVAEASDTLNHVATAVGVVQKTSLSESAAVSDTLNEVQTEGFVNRFESLSESLNIVASLSVVTTGEFEGGPISCNFESINLGTGVSGTACNGGDTSEDDGNVRTIDEEKSGPNHFLDVDYFFTTSQTTDVSKLNITINAWDDGESMSVFILNASSSNDVDTGIDITATADGTTYTATLCESGCDITGNPSDFITPQGDMQLTIDDDSDDKTQDTLSIDLMTIDVILSLTESLSESVSVSDTLSEVFTNVPVINTNSLSESVTISDTLTRQFTNVATSNTASLTESAAVADTLVDQFNNVGVANTASLTESAAVADTLVDQFNNVGVANTASLTESAAVADTLVDQFNNVGVANTASLTESAAVADTLVDQFNNVGVANTASLTESAAVADTLVDQFNNVGVANTASLTESAAVADTLVDQFNNVGVANTASLTESAAVADTLVDQFNNVGVANTASLTESAAVADTLVDQFNNVGVANTASLTESAAVADTLVDQFNNVGVANTASLTESAAVADTLVDQFNNVGVANTASLTESAAVADTLVDQFNNVGVANTASLTESAAVADTLVDQFNNVGVANTASLTESAAVADTLVDQFNNVGVANTASLTESAAVADTLVDQFNNVGVANTASLTESAAVADTLVDQFNNVGVANTASLTESAAVADTLVDQFNNVGVANTASLTESAAVADTLVDQFNNVGVANTASLTESAAVADTLVNQFNNVGVANTASLTESAAVADTLVDQFNNVGVANTASLTESAAVADTLVDQFNNVGVANTASLTESAAVADTLVDQFNNVGVANTASLTESAAVADTLVDQFNNVGVANTASLTESAAVADTLTETFNNVGVANTASLTESAAVADTLVDQFNNVGVANTASLTESAAVADTLVDQFNNVGVANTASLTESAAVADTLVDQFNNVGVANTASLTESAAVADTLVDQFNNVGVANTASLTESAAVADTLVDQFNNVGVANTASLTESAAVADTLVDQFNNVGVANTASLTESAAVADTLVDQFNNVGVANTASLTESAAVADTLVDQFNNVGVANTASLTESAAVADTLVDQFNNVGVANTASLTESAAVADTLVDQFNNVGVANTASLTESAAVADTLVDQFNNVGVANTASLTESAAVADTLVDQFNNVGVANTASLTESAAVADTLVDQFNNVGVANTASLTESAAVADTLVDQFNNVGVANTASLTESAAVADTLTETFNNVGVANTASLTESAAVADTLVDQFNNVGVANTASLTESAAVADTLVDQFNNVGVANTASLTESAAVADTLTETFNNVGVANTASLTESAAVADTLVDQFNNVGVANTASLTESAAVNATYIGITTENSETIINPSTGITTVNVSKSSTILNLGSSSDVSQVVISKGTNNVQLFLGTPTANKVTNTKPITMNFDIPHTNNPGQKSSGKLSFSSNTTFTGSALWNGKIQTHKVLSLSIPDQTSGNSITSFSAIAATELGSETESINIDPPARIEFTGDGTTNDFDVFFQIPGDSLTFITNTCPADFATAGDAKTHFTNTGIHECSIDTGDDIVVWTDHFTKFGAAKKSTRTTSSESSGPSGGGGATGAGPSGGSTSAGGIGGFGGILGTPLTINEVSYDKCEENIARIIVSSDADQPPTVRVHTAKSGSIFAQLAETQPYEEQNKITKVDKYLYELPIVSDESFMMVVVTEEKGTLQNTVQAAIRTIECQDTTVISEIPAEQEFEKLIKEAPKIFDVKFQIENGTKYRSEDKSEFYYVDQQDLTISAIIDSQSEISRVELRTVTLGQPDDEYVAIRMNTESLPFSNSTYTVSGTMPSFMMQEPAIKYWIHVIDEQQRTVESKHYVIGVKPTTEPDVSLELDIPTIKASNSNVRPSLYINNDQLPSYGIVSLLIDGKVVSSKAQLIETGQTKIAFDWSIPDSEGLVSYDVQGKVDLYGTTKVTESFSLETYPDTMIFSAYDMKSLSIIEKDGQALVSPALIYASDPYNGQFQFRVVAPDGQCILGPTEECAVQDSTRGQRGGFSSIVYNEQVLRVKYTGPENPLERFSITSVDPITGNWTITLETEEGLIPQAQAMKDLEVKVKHRFNSEMNTVYSE